MCKGELINLHYLIYIFKMFKISEVFLQLNFLGSLLKSFAPWKTNVCLPDFVLFRGNARAELFPLVTVSY